MEAESLEPEVIMAIDETGQSTPMACGISIVLVKKHTGTTLSLLAGSKSMIEKNVLPKGVRLTQSN